jgi:hypothetical protein
MGVTTLAQVNGAGAYSARNAAKGKSKHQRIQAARALLNNSGGKTVQKRGRRASFVSNATPAAKRRGKRLAAYNAAKKRGLTKNAAARSALRKVPWSGSERTGGSSFQGMAANKRRKSPKRKRSGMTPNALKLRKSPKRKRVSSSPTRKRVTSSKSRRRAATAGKDPKRVAAGRKAARTRAKRKGTTKVATKKRKTTKRRRKTASQYQSVKTTKRVRVKYGKYKRVRMKNPRTGKMQYSYMYRTKSGKMRRIPTSAIVGAKAKGMKELPAKVRKGRVRAARRIIKSGGAFVANKASSRARRRAAEKGRLVRKGMSKAKAARAALRKHPFTATEKSRGKRMLKSGKIVARKSKGTRKVSRKGRKSKGRKTTKRKTTKRRKATTRKGVSRKRSLAAKRGWAKRRRSGTAPKKRSTKRKGSTKRRSTKRKGTMSRTKRSAAAKKAWRTRKRRYGKKGYRKNADLFASLLTTAALVGVGFLLHRGLTAGVLMLLTGDQNGGATEVPVDATSGFGRYRRRRALRGLGQTNGGGMTKPLVGAGVALVGSVGAVYVGGESGPALAAGMIASVLGQGLVALLKATGQVELAAALGGYSNSMAFNLRGVGRVRRRAMRGFGAARSIMPRYSPVGAFMQAAAGTHNPNRPTGEYFVPNAVGEYFAPANLQGVGSYEPAGQLAMQASAGLGEQPIDDGIRPDTNLDRVLDLAEAAAGLRGLGQARFAQAAAGMPGGIGEFITAERQNGNFQESRVPTSSQWIPNGPLWAGTLGVTGDVQTSDIPAGILAGPGGNGILSGG